jgi:PadR family transcriptional regulator, regulatory protein PadR
MLGEFEQIVLLAVLRIGDEAYGVAITDEIHREAGREVTLATVYKTLSRLEEKGLVSSALGDPTPERGGRRKRFYTVTAMGRRSLRSALTTLGKLARGLDLGWEGR